MLIINTGWEQDLFSLREGEREFSFKFHGQLEDPTL